ncbi:hypothetical protein SAY86_028928 [Trapa natans]|uniref:Uncharacterized protein n=1 Tax=Trapa natans TaxID=22666 RepID=A0AAN7M290_TRANT|nr:hypothetical protein SAY86_028928 [Trapa natans]
MVTAGTERKEPRSCHRRHHQLRGPSNKKREKRQSVSESKNELQAGEKRGRENALYVKSSHPPFTSYTVHFLLYCPKRKISGELMVREVTAKFEPYVHENVVAEAEEAAQPALCVFPSTG